MTLSFPVHCLDDSQFITLRIKSGSYIRFQVDTGAQCNVLPLDTYKKATGDNTLSDVTATNTQVTAYGGATLPVIGSVILVVWREGSKYRLECRLVDSLKIRPLLGHKACLVMKVIKYLDNDAIHKPVMGNAPVYALEPAGPVTIEKLEKEHPRVFGPGVGRLEEYHIVLDDGVLPMQDPPRRVPVPLRESLKNVLDDLVQQDILAPVQQPTPWVSSMVVVPKKDGQLRICLDPRELNKAIRWEHSHSPPSRTLQLASMGPKCSLCWMSGKGSGMWSWKRTPLSSLLSTHPLEGIGRREFHLVSALLLRSSSGGFTNSLRG